jgi:TP901 family phage tail tape measure protein
MTGMTIGVTLSLIDRLSAPLKGVMGGVERLSTKIAAAGAAAHALSSAISGVSQRAQAIAMTSAQAFVAFDDARALLASMPGVTDEALTRITNRARAFTRENKVTLGEYLDTTYNILSAGIPEALANYATEVSVKVAQATRGATAEAGEAVAILYNNMRDPTREMSAEFARMGDVLTATQQRFQLKNLEQLTEGLKYATSAAKTAKLSVEDMNAALGRLNSAGLQYTMAGTALANMLANRFKAAKEIGFKVAVKKGTGELDLLRTLENLKRAVGDVNKITPQMEEKLRKGFGEEGFRAVMLLLGQIEVFKEDLQAIRNSAGSFERASKIINESAGAKWQQAMNRLNDLWLRLGEAMKPALDWLGEWITRLTDGLNALLDRFPKLSKWIGAAVLGVAGLSAALAAVGTALIGLAALGKLRQIKDIIGSLFGKTGKTGAPATERGGLGSLLPDVQKVWVVNMPGGGFGGALPDIGGVPGKAGEAARTLGSRIRSIIAGGWMQLALAWQTLAGWGGKLIGIAGSVGSAIASAAGVAGRAILWLGRAVLLNPIGLILTAIAAAAYLIWRNWDTIGPKLTAVWQAVKGAFVSAWEWISALPGKMLAIGSQIIEGLIAGLRARWEAIKEVVSSIASGIADSARSALGIRSPSRVFAEIGGNLMGGLQLGIERAASLPLAAMRGVASALAAPITAGAIAFAPLAQAVEPVVLPQPADALRPIRQGVEPSQTTALPSAASNMPGAASSPAPIQIVVNLNGPASHEAAQDVAAAVRREVERVLAEQSRRDALARRARLIDGGIA